MPRSISLEGGILFHGIWGLWSGSSFAFIMRGCMKKAKDSERFATGSWLMKSVGCFGDRLRFCPAYGRVCDGGPERS